MSLDATERRELQRRIDAARREREQATADGILHGREYAYVHHRCRCSECRQAAAEARRRRFQAQPQETRWDAQRRYKARAALAAHRQETHG